jgi:hypothetical protein
MGDRALYSDKQSTHHDSIGTEPIHSLSTLQGEGQGHPFVLSIQCSILADPAGWRRVEKGSERTNKRCQAYYLLLLFGKGGKEDICA